MTLSSRVRAGLQTLRSSVLAVRHSLPMGDLDLPERQEDGGRIDVAVVGAGLSGLAAAWRLSAAGRSVVVLEARGRPGGRVWTRRDGPERAPPVEAGAARIRDDHLWTRRFLRLAGVSRSPFYPQDRRLVVVDGSRRWLTRRSLSPWSCHAVLAARDEPDPGRWGRSSPEHGASPDPASWRENLTAPRWKRASAGLDRLPRALADALGPRVRYRAPVRALDADPQGVTVQCSTSDGHEEAVEARSAVCAVPLTVLGDIEFRPPIPRPRRELAARVPYEDAVRTFVHVAGDGWLPDGLNGFGRSSRIGEVWCRTPPEAGYRPPGEAKSGGAGAAGLSTLVAYCQGPKARRLNSLARERRIRETIDALEAMFPGVREAVVEAHTLSWKDETWSRGAQARTWDVDPWPVPELRKPHGRVRFAGEHLATPGSAGWMDGALESGWTVAGEVEACLP